MGGKELLSPSQITTASIGNAALDDSTQNLSNIEAIPSCLESQCPGLGGTKGDSGLPHASNSTTSSQAVQIRASNQDKSNQEKSIHHEHIATIYQKNMPTPQTAIIVYDVSQTMAFVRVFADLKGVFTPLPRSFGSDVILSCQGRRYISYPLPRTGQQVEIGERPKLIAKVNLGQLGWRTRVRRWKGRFPRIYVLNHAAHPLQSG